MATTTFDRRRFVGNRAFATGGAIETAAVYDAFVTSVYEGNAAGTGGALRLAGTASVVNCSFVENPSSDGGGAAVASIGVISSMSGVAFKSNAFDCQGGTFLDIDEVSCDVRTVPMPTSLLGPGNSDWRVIPNAT